MACPKLQLTDEVFGPPLLPAAGIAKRGEWVDLVRQDGVEKSTDVTGVTVRVTESTAHGNITVATTVGGVVKSRVLGWPGGRVLVAVAGVAIVGVGLWNLYRGLSQSFEDKWRVGSLSPVWRRWGGRAGVAGHVARCVVLTLIGVFVVKAAWDYNPRAAIGIDGALQKLAHASYGPYLLGVTAAGLIAYGSYCLVDARLRDVSSNA